MKRVYEVLLAEPFNLSREQIGELTDWHVWHQYIRPALRRSRPKKRVRGKSDRLPTRDEYIATGAQLGGNPDDLGRAYDQWAASEEGQRLAAGDA